MTSVPLQKYNPPLHSINCHQKPRYTFDEIKICSFSLHGRILSTVTPIGLYLKYPYHQNFYFRIWSAISCTDLRWKGFSIWIKSDYLWSFKNLKILFYCGLPMPLIISSTCSEMWRRFRKVWPQGWSRLFRLCKFTFVVHAKCSIPAFCMKYQVKFIEVKQTRWVKPKVTCTLIYVTTHSKSREVWCEW